SGVEWADPLLLHGPLAADLFERLLGGRELLGDVHCDRIHSMVAHHTVGNSQPGTDVAFGDAAFFLADSRAAHEYLSLHDAGSDWAEELYRAEGWRVALSKVRNSKAYALQAAGVTLHPDSLAGSDP